MVRNTRILLCSLSISHRVGWGQKCRRRCYFSIPVALHSPSKSALMGWWRVDTLCITASIIHSGLLHLEQCTGSLGCFNEPLQFLSDNLCATCAYTRLFVHELKCCGLTLTLTLDCVRTVAEITVISASYFSPTFPGSRCVYARVWRTVGTGL